MIITNGNVFFNGKFSKLDILIEDEKIIKVGNQISADGEERVDATELVVLPGLIDLHVHLREPGAEYKEDFNSGTMAAVAGGITNIFDMPNNRVAITTAKLMREKIALAERKKHCKIGFYLGAATGNENEWKAIADEKRFSGLKVYMGQTTGSLLVRNDAELESHFSGFDANRPIVVHAEDQKMLESEGRTEGAALSAVGKACALGRKYGKKLHIAHASTGKEVELAKRTYANCTLETCPHYLFLDENDWAHLGYRKAVNPPLRKPETRKALWGYLDSIDCISTDHAPHTLEDKQSGASGYPGLETSLALMLDAYNRKLITMERIVQMMSENPARIIGLDRNGKIAEGAVADITIIDPKKEWVVKEEELETKCKWSPFNGKILKGKAVKTIVDGKIVFEDDAIR
jgi:dihydroorotase